MITQLHIQNYKSIEDLTLDLGRINVFIGDNGCGKTNILEALAVGAAVNEGGEVIKNENLSYKGVRVARPDLTMNLFQDYNNDQIKPISIVIKFNINNDIETENSSFEPVYLNIELQPNDNLDIYSYWRNTKIDSYVNKITKDESIRNIFRSSNELNQLSDYEFNEKLDSIFRNIWINSLKIQIFENFCIYNPNILTLRGYFQQSQIQPLGINGEGLDLLIANLEEKEIEKLKEYIYFISWLEDFETDFDNQYVKKGYKLNRSQSELYFKDKFLKKNNDLLSTENVNEGVLFVLFYLTLFISHRTPKIFGIDNIEQSLNPHLCRFLMKTLCEIAKETDKQALITTHNPAILDGLNLNDPEIRLFEVYRNDEGRTLARRIEHKDGRKDKLSNLWTSGFLGGISREY